MPFEDRASTGVKIASTGDVIGTSADRPGMDLAASGDPTQQDCVDEATNTTSYLLVLQANGLLRHHTVGTPFSKENPLRGVAGWPHWTAVLKENASPQRWAVDGWIYANGENPAVVEVEKWYIAGLAELHPQVDQPGRKAGAAAVDDFRIRDIRSAQLRAKVGDPPVLDHEAALRIQPARGIEQAHADDRAARAHAAARSSRVSVSRQAMRTATPSST